MILEYIVRNCVIPERSHYKTNTQLSVNLDLYNIQTM